MSIYRNMKITNLCLGRKTCEHLERTKGGQKSGRQPESRQKEKRVGGEKC